MSRFAIAFFLLAAAGTLQAQEAAPSTIHRNAQVYQTTPEKINNLVHTKLEARFDYTKSQLNGKVWLTLQPHFYPTDSLRLDAKGMNIKQVALVRNGKNSALKYTYDSLQLDIDLDRTYRRGESYVLYLEYTAKPNDFKTKGSAAITDAKGLYFINPLGTEANKPTQIWTQGETEATSVWVPTIDRPNQKTTQEFYLTVPAKYVSLSNGKLVSQKTNSDGTRTDYWKMDQPHAPYLFFMGVGDFAVVKDNYKGKEVSYYVEKDYAGVARRIFGMTPEMMQFFSKITGVEYPWVKYAQMVVRDYVSGAMENTTATLHGESAQQDARQLTDGNSWEDVIAHELFHHWFGDYVTSESWSNLTLNESFANYSEYLWREYKYGKESADAHSHEDMQGYIMSGSEEKDLVRFDYRDKEDMFDAVSYNKGGRILHMLRNYIGDSAFFKGMNLYLTTNKYKTAEAHQLRLAFEEVTGKDLNPFFNQWYFGKGHPKLDITYNYNDAAKQVQVIVRQTQDSTNLFQLPTAIDVYQGNDRMRYNVWVKNRVDTFVFAAQRRPDLVNFDAEKVLLAEKKENKTLQEYAFQYQHGRNFMDRYEALATAAEAQAEQKAVEMLMQALNDPYHELRSMAIQNLDLKKHSVKTLAEEKLYAIAQKDPKRTVKAAAISKLGEYGFAKYVPLFRSAISDSSYTVAASGLEALSLVDTAAAAAELAKLPKTGLKGALAGAATRVMIQSGDESNAETILTNFEAMPLNQAKFESMVPLIQYLGKVQSLQTFKRGIDDVVGFVMAIPEAYRGQVQGFVENMLRQLSQAKTTAGQKEQAAYITSKIAENFEKKSF